MSDITCTLSGLGLHPVKSCGALAPREALLVETGFDLDRAWMVVDPQGEMLTQREHPKLALVKPTLRLSDLLLKAPGMLGLHLALDAAETPTRVRVWDDVVKAWDMGNLAGQWFSDYLGTPARVVRFDPEETRLADRAWTGEAEAPVEFADGFPLLVASLDSLGDLNRRLAEAGAEPVTMARFRPNLVLSGLQPWDEDHLDTLEITTDDGPVRLKLVKPCSRCQIPNVDPVTGELQAEPGRTLASFRADARMKGAVTFGMNAIVLEGAGRTLRAGQTVQARFGV
ncbi:MAG: MOSC domain-containing protein [Burkholderiaceae bacterium]|nr:MOSC domain-containing protein [Burkholderiaceae bacterium]